MSVRLVFNSLLSHPSKQTKSKLTDVLANSCDEFFRVADPEYLSK